MVSEEDSSFSGFEAGSNLSVLTLRRILCHKIFCSFNADIATCCRTWLTSDDVFVTTCCVRSSDVSGMHHSERYEGASWCWHLYANKHSL